MKDVFHLLEQSGANYCVLHGWQSLPEGLSSDLDIVVAPADLARLEEAFLQDDVYQIVQVLQHEVSCFYFVLAQDDGRGVRFIPVDVATEYRRNGRGFLTAEALLADRRRARGIWVAAPRAEFAYLLAKKIAKRSLPEAQGERLRLLLVDLEDEGETLARHLLGADLGRKAIVWLRSEDRSAFEGNLGQLQLALRSQASRRPFLTRTRGKLSELERVWRRWLYPTGFLVAVLGPDGSGKSTLIANLQERLAGAFRRTETFHFRPGVVRRVSHSAPIATPHAEKSRSWLASVLKALHYLADFKVGYACQIRPMLARSTLVLFDRYFDDVLVDPRRYRYGGPLGILRLIRSFVPRPDLFLILDLPPDRILERKQEVPSPELHRQRRAYLDLAKDLPNVVLLDGTLPMAELAYQAAQAVIQYMHGRYREQRHHWFTHRATDDSSSDLLQWLQGAMSLESTPRGN